MQHEQKTPAILADSRGSEDQFARTAVLPKKVSDQAILDNGFSLFQRDDRPAFQMALSYVEKGWSPVPMPFKTKRLTTDGWQNIRIKSSEDVERSFSSGPMNVAVMLGPSSNGLTDIDLDCPEAIALAPYLLPRTEAIFGRKSTKGAHWLYYLDQPGTKAKEGLQDPDFTAPGSDQKAMIVELRSGGGGKGAYTVFPGSIHADTGEPIEWEKSGDPAKIGFDDLLQSVKVVAAATLLLRSWSNGSRHDFALLIGAFLGHCGGWTEEKVETFIEAIARAAGDDELEDRLKAARDGFSAASNGEVARGLPALIEAIGEKRAKKVAVWLDHKSEKASAPAKPKGDEDTLSGIAEQFPLPETSELVYSELEGSGAVWVHKPVYRAKGVQTLVPVSSPFGISARFKIMDDPKLPYGKRVLVKDQAGEVRTIDVPSGDLAGTSGRYRVLAQLMEAGLCVGDGREAVLNALSIATPEKELLIVRKPGFHSLDYKLHFITPGGQVLGPQSDVELSANARIPDKIAKGGTFEGWMETTAAALSVEGGHHWRLGVASGFAGTIVAYTGMDSCGMCLSGMSSAGKTTAQKLAASAWSKPSPHRDSLYQSVKATANGMEVLAARSSGMVLVLDELAQISGREIGNLIMTFASGAGKRRMNGDESLRQGYTWETFMVLSSERSLEDRVRSDEGQWTAGSSLRVVDIDVTDVNRSVPRDTMTKIEGFNTHYGHAGPMFVERLLQITPDEVRRMVEEKAVALAGKGAPSTVIRSARPFAILWTSGELAKRFGLVPPVADFARSIKWAFERFLASADVLNPTDQAIARLRQWILERWGSSVQHIVPKSLSNLRDAVAWYDETAVYIPAERLVEAAGSSLKEQEIVKALDKAGMITAKKSQKHLSIGYIKGFGKIKAYALSRKEFGREDAF